MYRDDAEGDLCRQCAHPLCCTVLVVCQHYISDAEGLRSNQTGLLIRILCVSSGVADGVGGWRDYGVDPSQFSGTLMKTCERLVKEGRFVPSNPVGVLTSSYYELLQNKVPLLGESHTLTHKTFCLSSR